MNQTFAIYTAAEKNGLSYIFHTYIKTELNFTHFPYTAKFIGKSSYASHV
jgi:hypothetical protein